jgi:hypothetical protein
MIRHWNGKITGFQYLGTGDDDFSQYRITLRPGPWYHFAAAKQSATRVARIEKAMPAILEGRGFLERR